MKSIFSLNNVYRILVSSCAIFILAIPVTKAQMVSGTVQSKESNNLLTGVTVRVKGTSNGALTNENGAFKLEGVKDNDSLVFSYIGYRDLTVPVDGRNTIKVSLTSSASSLDELVVVGYGKQKKISLTGAVDVISNEELEGRPAYNLGDLVKGASPNLNISMGMRGGEPGSTSSWNIRGMGSINGNTSPLILVDGVESFPVDIEPNEIESISILKDAAAAAIYGSRAAFGVILITTKKGTKDGKVHIKYSNNLSFSQPLKVPHYVDAYTWAVAFNEASHNIGAKDVYSKEQMERIKGYMNGTFPYEYDPENPIDYIWGGRRDGNANYDWPHILIANYAFSQKHNINVDGGNERTQYHIGGTYLHQNGMYAFGYDYYERYNVLVNLNTKIADWLTFSPSLKYTNRFSNYPLGETTVGREHQFREMIMFAPMMPFYNINGTIQSPLVRQQQGTGRNKSHKDAVLLTFQTNIEPIKGWNTKISYNYYYIGNRNTTNPKPIDVENGDGSIGNIGKPTSGYTSLFEVSKYQKANIISSYEFEINDRHYFKPMIGYEQDKRFYTRLNATGTNLIVEEVPSLTTSLGDKTVDDRLFHWATQSVFGRLNYNYKEKYLLGLTARYDGSSRFGEGSRWGLYPSASLGYVISSEHFWKSIKPYVNTFKLRASYGSLGNQNVSDYYSYLAPIKIYNELDWILAQERPVYATDPQIISADLTWETVTTFNLGLNASFLDSRLDLTFDWYKRITSNMIGPAVSLPYTLGTSAPRENNAKLKTVGFELLLAWQDQISRSLSYNLKFGIGDNRSTILKYRNDKGTIDTWYAGKDVGEIWGLISEGLIQEKGEKMADQSKYYNSWGPGDMKYRDVDGNGVIDDGSRTIDDHGDIAVIGNSSPRYNLNFTLGINWKNIDFNMFWQGIAKRDFFPDRSSTKFWGMTRSATGSGLYKNSPALDYWRPADETNLLGPNTDAYLPKPYFSTETRKNRQVQSKYILNAGYFRLKNLQIGYTLPKKILKNIFIERVRVFFSGENLLLITELPEIFDPETAIASDPQFGGYLTSGVIYPISRSYSFGINVRF